MDKVPTFLINETEVNEAYEAFAALRRVACAEPHLIDNPFFSACQDAAYARFLARFEARS